LFSVQASEHISSSKGAVSGTFKGGGVGFVMWICFV
jgi:hypothetical protein